MGAFMRRGLLCGAGLYAEIEAPGGSPGVGVDPGHGVTGSPTALAAGVAGRNCLPECRQTRGLRPKSANGCRMERVRSCRGLALPHAPSVGYPSRESSLHDHWRNVQTPSRRDATHELRDQPKCSSQACLMSSMCSSSNSSARESCRAFRGYDSRSLTSGSMRNTASPSPCRA